MLKFYYNPAYKYTNRTIIDLTNDSNFREIDYENIDSPDTINGHIIYTLTTGESIPTYIHDSNTSFRWFVSGITQLRTGKYQISLLRDVISESNNWKTEQAYIEAGTATDFCKYKKWGLPFTNTKVGEQRLNINGKSSFFVYYVNEQNITNDLLTETDLDISYNSIPGITQIDYDYDSISEMTHYNWMGQTVRSISDFKGIMYLTDGTEAVTATSNATTHDYSATLRQTYPPASLNTNVACGIWTNPTTTQEEYISTQLQVQLGNFVTSKYLSYSLTNKVSDPDVTMMINKYVGKIIRVPNQNNGYDFYTVSYSQDVNQTTQVLPNADTESLSAGLESAIESYTGYNFTYSNRGDSHYINNITIRTTTFELVSLGTALSFDFSFKADSRKLNKSSVRCVNIVSDDTVSDETISQCLMLCMANPDNTDQLGRIIDIQYLPFQVADNTTNANNANFQIGSHNLIACAIDTDDVLYSISMSSLTNINKETDSVVIVSPSRKSQFMFSPYNNDGRMVFDFKATLRPNQSIMYIRPSTQGLLLYDWNDKECLIIQEDFSLTKIDSAWTEYVYNNRNYQNAFNLQIQTKEFERSWERRIEKVQAQSDTWKAREITAEKVRFSSGNIPILSNIYAAAASGFEDKLYMQAAQLDRQYNEAMYQKGLEVARTNFEYQIDNVKSQPLIPNTITAIDVKMLDGVYLEFYSTNDTEKNSIELFYLHNGNRIDNYGTFQQYYGPFIRGKIIRSNSYTQPEIDEINRRLEMGIYTS